MAHAGGEGGCQQRSDGTLPIDQRVLLRGAARAGIMLFRNRSLDMVNVWIDVIERDQNVWDQNAFNDLYRV